MTELMNFGTIVEDTKPRESKGVLLNSCFEAKINWIRSSLKGVHYGAFI